MSGVFQESFIEKVKESNDIIDVVGEYIPLKRAGANYKGVCPFHNEKTPSFVVSPAKQIYHCFGCSAGGDVIKFVSDYKHWEFGDAVEYLAERAGLELEKENYSNTTVTDTRAKLYELNREAALYYHNILKSNEEALNYLDNRGITKTSVVTYGIGYALDKWEGLYKYLKSKGYQEKEMLQLGLVVYNEKRNSYYDRFRGRIIFPIIDIKQRVIGFGGRVIDNNNKPKYLNSSDSEIFNKGNNLFSLNILRKKTRERKLILTEGYLDVISLFQNEIYYAVASLGTALTLEQVKLIKKNATEIFICYDTDNAGLNATKRALDIFIEADIRPKVILLNGAKDPDEFILKYGKQAFLNAIEKSVNPLEFYDYDLQQKFNIEDAEEKLQYIESLFSILVLQKNKTEVDLYLRTIADKLEIDTNIFKEDFYKRYNKKNNNFNKLIKSTISNSNFNNANTKKSYYKVVLEKQYKNLPYGVLYGATCLLANYKVLDDHKDIIESFNEELLDIYDEICRIYETDSSKVDLEIVRQKLENIAGNRAMDINQYKNSENMTQAIIKLKEYCLRNMKIELQEIKKLTTDEEQIAIYNFELNEIRNKKIEMNEYFKLK